MRYLLPVAMTVVLSGCAGTSANRPPLAQARYEAAQRPRRVVFNNDGDDHIQAEAPTVEAFLAVRSTPLIGSQVDTVVYCTSRPFGMFTHNTKVGEVLDLETFPPDRHNIVPDFIAMGTDPLQVMSEFCRRNGLEIIWSMRMNDTHDAGHSPEKPHYYFSDFKRTHPECLLGTREKPPRLGAWNAVNFECDTVRDFALKVFEEICRDYDVDGIEMDFFRHVVFFPSVAAGGKATDRERDLMTDLVRRTRRMMDRVGSEKGRPLLLTARVPDSVPYCHDMGLDITRWFDEGLVDIFVAGGDFRLNAWQESVDVGRRYDVPVWCDLDPSPRYGDLGRFPRNDIRVTRARAAAAWAAGADAVYTFNWFDPTHPLWQEIGDPAMLRHLPKWYMANVTGRTGYLNPRSGLVHGMQYDKRTQPHPGAPGEIDPGGSLDVPMALGPEDPQSTATLHVLATGTTPSAALNGTALKISPDSPGQGQWTDFSVPTRLLRPGQNHCVLTVPDSPANQEANEWDVAVEAAAFADDKSSGIPFSIGRNTDRTFTRLQDDALLIVDRGDQPGDYTYVTHGWNASHDEPRIAEFDVQVLSGKNGILLGDGSAEERIWLYPDRIEAEFAKAEGAVDLTGRVHTVRIEATSDGLSVSVDGRTVIETDSDFVYPAVNGRNMLMFGASTSGTKGEALWYAARYRVGGASHRVYDVVLSVIPPQ